MSRLASPPESWRLRPRSDRRAHARAAVACVLGGVLAGPAWADDPRPQGAGGAAGGEPAPAPDEPTLSRFVRIAPPPGSVPDPKATPSPSPSRPASVKYTAQPIDHDERLTAQQAAVVGPTLPGVPIDSRAFARFGPCTATHLGDGVYLTAGHCIDQQTGLTGYRSSPCPFGLLLPDAHDTVPCKVVAFAYDAARDHALLELIDRRAAAGLPSVPVDYTLAWATAKKRWIRLYGYSGNELRANLWCEARWDAATSRLLHTCDTDGGDSGAALIDMMTGHVIGTHGGALARGTSNYGFPIDRVPWAEARCVAVTTSPRIEVLRGGGPAAIRASTSLLDPPPRRLVVRLKGTTPRANTRVRVRGPGVEMAVDPAWITWAKDGSWTWTDLLVLDQSRPGPWSVEVVYLATPKNKLVKGTLDGRIWICP